MKSIFANHRYYQCINRKASWIAKIFRWNSFSQPSCRWPYTLGKYSCYLRHNNWLSERRQTDTPGTGSLCCLSYLLGFSQSEHLFGMGGRSWRSPSPLQKGTMDPKAETQPMLGGPQSPLYCCVGSTACISLRTLPHTSTGAIKKKGRKHPPTCLRWSTKEGKPDIEEKGEGLLTRTSIL